MKGFTKIIVLITFSICLQGCSYLHRFEIKNTTEDIWNVEYEIIDSRGVFRNKIAIKNSNSKEDKPQIFQGSVVSFSLMPKETASLFWIYNKCYDVYKENAAFDEAKPWETFINVKNIKLTSGDETYVLDPSNLEKFFDKNRRNLVRVNIQKVVDYFVNQTS